MSQRFSNMKSSCLGLLHIACVGQHSMTADTPRINSLCWGRIPTPCTHGPGLHIHDLLDFLHPQSHDTRMALRLLSICCSMTILPTQILFRLFCPAISRMCKLLSMTQIREAGPQFCGAAAIDEVYSSSWLLSLASALRTLMFSCGTMVWSQCPSLARLETQLIFRALHVPPHTNTGAIHDMKLNSSSRRC